MEIKNLDADDVEKMEKFINTEIKPDNPFVRFRVYDTTKELTMDEMKGIIKEAVKEVLQEVEVMREYKKIINKT